MIPLSNIEKVNVFSGISGQSLQPAVLYAPWPTACVILPGIGLNSRSHPSSTIDRRTVIWNTVTTLGGLFLSD